MTNNNDFQPLIFQLLEEAPQHHPARNRDVDGVLDPELRDFESSVAKVYNLLRHTLHLVAEDQRIAPPWGPN